MHMRRLFDRSNGITTYIEAEGGDLKFFHEFDDVSPTLEASKAMANDDQETKKQIKDGFWHYAHIPDSLLLKWHIEEGIDLRDQKALFAKVNSRDYRYLKCTGGLHVAR